MKGQATDAAAQAMMTTLGVVAALSNAVQAALSPPISDAKAFAVAAVGAVAGSLIAAFSSSGGRVEKIATAFSCLGFGVFLGPLSGQIVISGGNGSASHLQVIVGASFLWALIGWPCYLLVRAIFEAAQENADGLFSFIARVADKFLTRKK